MNKKNFDFKASCDRMLKHISGEKSSTLGAYEFTLDTIAGPLHCASKEDWLACIFTDVKAAKQKIHTGALNPHSGKWNWMFTNPGEGDVKEIFKSIANVMDVSDFDLISNYTSEKEKLAPSEDMNTKVTFMYRDGSNYKATKEVTFSGVADQDLNSLIFSCDISDENCYFIPGQVDLEDLQHTMGSAQWDPDIDHPWHQIIAISPVRASESEADDERSISEFIDAMSCLAVSGWDDEYKPVEYQAMLARYNARVLQE